MQQLKAGKAWFFPGGGSTVALIGFFALCTLLAVCGCTGPGARPARIALPPQDAAAYLKPPWRVAPEVQRRLAAGTLAEYFQCWNDPRPSVGLEAMREELAKAAASPGLGENLLPRSDQWARDLAANADLGTYPSQAWPGLTTDWLDLRVLPTARPALEDADLPGALAFDRLQQSLLPPNLPAYVHHASRDRAWLLVQTPIAWGWLPANRVARLDRTQVERWQAPPHLVAVRDEATVWGPDGRFWFRAGLGSLLPAADRRGRVLAATMDQDGRAVLRPADCPPGAARPYPEALDSRNLAAMIDRLLGAPYGWGGLYGNRDCSATLQDLFRVFGLWLPRNSSDQAKAGRVVDLAGLDPAAKEEAIHEHGLPGLSLLYMPGHIMLYLGRGEGGATAFHNVWGLRTEDLLGRQGRAILGRGVITTLRPGEELPDLALPGGLLINRLQGLTILLDPRNLIR